MMTKLNLPHIATILAFGLLPIAAESQSAGEVSTGRALFDSKYRCYTCHGYEGHGGMGPRLGSTKFSAEAFVAYVRHPRRMPAYSAKTISDADLNAIWSYLRSIQEPKKAADIPLLNDLLTN